MCAAMGKNWYVDPYLYVYGHTHHGGPCRWSPPFGFTTPAGG